MKTKRVEPVHFLSWEVQVCQIEMQRLLDVHVIKTKALTI